MRLEHSPLTRAFPSGQAQHAQQRRNTPSTTGGALLRGGCLLLALAGLTLSGCATDDPAADPAPPPDATGTQEDTADTDTSESDVEGTVTIDGRTLEAVSGRCDQVAIEDDAWRIQVTFADGEGMFDEPESGNITLETGEEWTISPNDTGPNLAVSGEGVSGESLAFVSGTDDTYVDISAAITCLR